MISAPSPSRLSSWLPRPADELLHEPSGDPAYPWKETWFVGLHDIDAGFALAMHMTVSPERSPSTRVAIAARFGADELCEVVIDDGVAGDRRFGNGLAHLEVVHSAWTSDHELRLVGSLPACEFEFVIRGLHSASLWDTMFPGFYQDGKASSHSYGHAEQSLTFAGTLRWRDRQEAALSGHGWRDRGWGRRRSTSSFSAGYDMVNGVLPDGGVFTMMAFRKPDLDEAAPLPIGAWYSDADSLVPAVGGVFLKDSIGWPQRIELSFADGRAFSSTLERRHFSIAVPFHDAAHDVVPVGHGIRDYFCTFVDGDGATFPVHGNSGHMHRVNVTHDARFVYADRGS